MKHRLLVVAIAAAVGSMSSIAVAESLEQSVATTMLNHPQIKEAYDLYLARTHQIDQARAGYKPKVDLSAGVGPEWINAVGASDRTDLTRKDAGITLRQMLFDGFDTSNNVDRTTSE